ncbi:MAG: hypothetical protein JRI23_19395 [Deltaproteobacteria bacterium]|nr:hypothetical protein [Deltaproteobacteria bacterium]MBW2534030.1 hypothetical protein [Deltaproteobacteria bacterium]
MRLSPVAVLAGCRFGSLLTESAYRAVDTNALGNFLYNGYPDGTSDEDLDGQEDAVGLTGGAGNNYFGLNQVRYWRTRDGSIQRSDQWWGDPGVVTGEETNITVPEWDDPAVGDRRFRRVRLPQMYPDPSFHHDLEWLYFSHDFPLGDATVEYDGTTHEVTLAGHKQGAGAAVDVDAPTWVDAANGKSAPAWYVYSEGGGVGIAAPA